MRARPSHCTLARGVARELRRFAETATTRERCGALIGSIEAGGRLRVRALAELENHDPRAGSFRIAPGPLVACERAARERGDALLGFFHTHPASAPRPSRADLEGAWPGHLVVVATTSGARAFLPAARGFVELDCTEVSA